MNVIATLLLALCINTADRHAHVDVDVNVLADLARRPAVAVPRSR